MKDTHSSFLLIALPTPTGRTDMTTIEDLNKIYTFKDAVKVLENILHETREERDVYASSDWDAFETVQQRVEVLEDALTALSFESSILHHVNAYDDRDE